MKLKNRKAIPRNPGQRGYRRLVVRRGNYSEAAAYMFGAASQAKTLADTLRREALKGESNEP